MTEYTNVNKTRSARIGQKILGCQSVNKKLKIQSLMRKFYGKAKSRYNPDPRNPFPYVFRAKKQK